VGDLADETEIMTTPCTFADLPRKHFAAILADPPWRFATYDKRTAVSGFTGAASVHYETLPDDEVLALPVAELAAEDSVLFLWLVWPHLPLALRVIDAWGFRYKTCAFAWLKGHAGQLELFHDDINVMMGTGYWTRANSEVCLLATRGRPKRLDAGVRQGIIEPRREHSRKPDCVHSRIERLVSGPYLELFARQSRPGWTSWGNEVTKFDQGERRNGNHEERERKDHDTRARESSSNVCTNAAREECL
jgi:N6-adenosine-specific RNA methylase IME4